MMVLAVAATACRGGTQSTQHSTNREVFPLEKRTGWFHSACLAISDPNVERGTNVDLVVIGKPQRVLKGRLGKKVSSASSCEPLSEERRENNEKPGTYFYSVESTKLTATDIGIGLVSPPQEPVIVNGLAQADLNSDGRPEVFSSCATAEGINFTIWTGKPSQGVPLWSRYYYLGYDMKPTCP